LEHCELEHCELEHCELEHGELDTARGCGWDDAVRVTDHRSSITDHRSSITGRAEAGEACIAGHAAIGGGRSAVQLGSHM